MEELFSRTELLLGKENMQKLKDSRIAIFGIGGVGSFVAEALVRCGIEKFILVDNDIVSVTNINRQIIATTKTIGKSKVEVMKNRILEINPDVCIETFEEFFSSNTNKIIDETVTYVVDAIDTVSSKLVLIELANKLNIPIISSMGTGNKLNPTMLEITDIYKTSVCPLAKVMRKELKKRNIKNLKVVYSKEQPIKIENKTEEIKAGSISFVPSTAGLIIASEVVKDIIR